MKKSKVILAIALAVILLVTLMNVPTFSWFTRPQPSATDLNSNSCAQSGDELKLVTKNSYKQYNGRGVTAVTKSSTTGVADPDSYSTTCSDSASLSGSGIQYSQRKYFCTTITNSSGTEQNVSLYARTLSIPTSSGGTLALGVNGPTRSYRDYSALAKPKSFAMGDSMRIYFQKPKNNTPDGWSGTEFYICWNEDTNTGIESLNALGTNGTYYHMIYCGEKEGYYNYYSDIPKTATHAFFACENWAENKPQSELTADHWKKRTQTLWNLGGDGQTQLQSKVYQLTGTVTSGNTQVHTPPYSVNGACINHYYSDIFVATGSTYNAALSNTTNIPTRSGYSANYIGTLKYYSGDTNVFTVNENTGEITPVNAGEATLYTKAIGGSYSDEQQVETAVHVTSSSSYVFKDVPIVHNVKIPASTENSANVVKVYWYVINNSKTASLSYTIDDVYVGL